jgi:hypothetical protein
LTLRFSLLVAPLMLNLLVQLCRFLTIASQQFANCWQKWQLWPTVECRNLRQPSLIIQTKIWITEKSLKCHYIRTAYFISVNSGNRFRICVADRESSSSNLSLNPWVILNLSSIILWFSAQSGVRLMYISASRNSSASTSTSCREIFLFLIKKKREWCYDNL